MFCPECGHDVPDDAKFCPRCGKNLTKAEEAPREEQAAVEEEAPPQPAVPGPVPPATPTEPEPAVPSEPTPPPATAETAREGAAEEIAEEPEEEPAYRPYQPQSPQPSPTPSPQASPQPTPRPTPQPAAETPRPSSQTPPPAAPSAVPPGPQQPPGQQAGQVPPGQQPPPPTGPAQGAAPPEEKKTNWGSICLIGCGILLALAILGGIGLFLLGRWAQDKVEELPDAPTNIMQDQDGAAGPEIREPGDEQAGEGGTDSAEPGSEDLGDLIDRLGEAVEGVGEAMSAANVEGFDPSKVDATMLPTFYGFLIALAEDDPQAMHQWMSPDMKQQWSPEANWQTAPQIEHLGYTLDEQTVLEDGTVKFVIEERIRDNDENTDKVISWEIHFEQIDGEWYVTYFE